MKEERERVSQEFEFIEKGNGRAEMMSNMTITVRKMQTLIILGRTIKSRTRVYDSFYNYQYNKIVNNNKIKDFLI